jgi:hypothetical protein
MVEEVRRYPFDLLAIPLEPVLLIHVIRRKPAPLTSGA